MKKYLIQIAGYMTGVFIVVITVSSILYQVSNFNSLEQNPRKYLSNYLFESSSKNDFFQNLKIKDYHKFEDYGQKKYYELKEKGLIENPNLVIIDNLCKEMEYRGMDASGKEWKSKPLFCKRISLWDKVLKKYYEYANYTPWSLDFFAKSEFGEMKPLIPTYKTDLMQLEMLKK